MIDPSLLQDFIAETIEHLEEMEEHILHLEKSPDDSELLNTIFRCVHTIKGSAEYLGMERIAGLMHNLESLLDRIRNNNQEINREIIDIIISSGDVVSRLTEDLEREQKELTSIEGPLGQIVRLLEQGGSTGLQQKNTRAAEPVQPSEPLEPGTPADKESPEDPFDDFLEALDLNPEGTLFAETPPEDIPETGQPVPEPVEETATLQETDDHATIYEEDYDAELFDIFIQQLREDLNWLTIETTAAMADGDLQTRVNSWKDKLVSLISSSNYMGYDKLTRIYEDWKEQVDGIIAKVSKGAETDWWQEMRSTAAENLRNINALFPQVEQVEDVVIEEDTPQCEIEEDRTRREPIDASAPASLHQSTLNKALEDKTSETALLAETPHEIVSDYLFTDNGTHEEIDPVHDGAVEAPVQDMNTADTGPFEESQSETGDSGTAEDMDSKVMQDEEGGANFSSRMRSQSIRVDATKIDSLMNQVGELVVSRAWFSQLHLEMRELKQRLLQDVNLDKRLAKQIKEMTFRLYEATGSLGRAANELQEGVMRIRMLPVARLFNRYPRLIHDLVKDGDKRVDLEIRGEDTELDKMVIEKISDPMIHIIRNAIDHGIEKRFERKKSGKPETAKLIIEAYHESNHVVIEVTDDGRGIDPQRIKATALEKNIMDNAALDRLTDREAISLITHPGFSTARTVTHTSGRGVGMDVVKKNIEKLNGTVEIDSVTGKETRIRIKIPLTLAIIPALLVHVETELFTIPLSTVEETIKVHVKDIESIEGNEVIYLRNQTIPLIRLNRVFNMSKANGDNEKIFIVIVSNGINRMGLVVDSMLGQEEVVIKPLEDYLQESSGFSGATILGDGRISLILDIYDLLNISVAKMELRRRANSAVMAYD